MNRGSMAEGFLHSFIHIALESFSVAKLSHGRHITK